MSKNVTVSVDKVQFYRKSQYQENMGEIVDGTELGL